jgi:hypothetical protein
MPKTVYIARLGYVLTGINKIYNVAAEDQGSVTDNIPIEIEVAWLLPSLKLWEQVVHSLRYTALLLVLSCSRDIYT